jgi:hypothetical protein
VIVFNSANGAPCGCFQSTIAAARAYLDCLDVGGSTSIVR